MYFELLCDIVFEIASTNGTRGTANDGSLNNLHDYEERNKRQSILLPSHRERISVQ